MIMINEKKSEDQSETVLHICYLRPEYVFVLEKNKGKKK